MERVVFICIFSLFGSVTFGQRVDTILVNHSPSPVHGYYIKQRRYINPTPEIFIMRKRYKVEDLKALGFEYEEYNNFDEKTYSIHLEGGELHVNVGSGDVALGADRWNMFTVYGVNSIDDIQTLMKLINGK